MSVLLIWGPPEASRQPVSRWSHLPASAYPHVENVSPAPQALTCCVTASDEGILQDAETFRHSGDKAGLCLTLSVNAAVSYQYV